MSEIDNWRADPDFAHALHHAKTELQAVSDLAERRGESHAEARQENRVLTTSLQKAMVALAERDDEIAALRKQAANLATALHKREAERDQWKELAGVHLGDGVAEMFAKIVDPNRAFATTIETGLRAYPCCAHCDESGDPERCGSDEASRHPQPCQKCAQPTAR